MDSSQTASSQTASSLADAVDARPHSSSPPASNEFDSLIGALEDLNSSVAIRLPSGLIKPGHDPQQNLFSVSFSSSISLSESNREDITYLVDGFPVWKSFCLFSNIGKDNMYTVLICPVFNGRCAVPMLQSQSKSIPTDHSQQTPSCISLWDCYEIRFFTLYQEAEIRTCVCRCMSIWTQLIPILVEKTSSFVSLNQILGALVLRRTIARCFSLYQLVMDFAKYGPLDELTIMRKTFFKCFAEWSEAMKRETNNSPYSHLWRLAAVATGY
jgi:hypothetical protein